VLGGQSLVKVIDKVTHPSLKTERTKRVDQLQAGDIVVVSDGKTDGGRATVVCVAKIKCSTETRMIKFPCGLTITPTHPIQADNGEWRYPEEFSDTKEKWVLPGRDGYVYNFVLSKKCTLVVNSKRCSTWGFDMNLPIGKPFYGAPIRHHLEQTRGWNEGDMEIVDGEIMGWLAGEPDSRLEDTDKTEL